MFEPRVQDYRKFFPLSEILASSSLNSPAYPASALIFTYPFGRFRFSADQPLPAKCLEFVQYFGCAE